MFLAMHRENLIESTSDTKNFFLSQLLQWSNDLLCLKSSLRKCDKGHKDLLSNSPNLLFLQPTLKLRLFFYCVLQWKIEGIIYSHINIFKMPSLQKKNSVQISFKKPSVFKGLLVVTHSSLWRRKLFRSSVFSPNLIKLL